MNCIQGPARRIREYPDSVKFHVRPFCVYAHAGIVNDRQNINL